MMRFFVITLIAFAAMEAIAYLIHRFVFHGPLWFLHRSHHIPSKGPFEWNDVFGLVFAPVAVVLMGGYLAPSWLEVTYPIGLGMTLYGAVYFFIHDIYTHRRLFRLDFENPWFKSLRTAHRRHHACVSKSGQEPFGFIVHQTYENQPWPLNKTNTKA